MTGEEPSNEPEELGKHPEKVGFFQELRRRKVYRVAATYLVVGWIIIQIANATFRDFGIPVWAYRFVVLMVGLGFPISLVLAWAFELTPDGIRTTKSARTEQDESEYHPKLHRKRNWMAYGVGALLPTLIFGTLAIIFYIRIPHQPTLDKSIAVLPFDNRSEQKEDEYFTDGIHDDLLTQISMIKDIKTISRTSVMVYKDSPKNLKTIGEELGVSTILEGGVQRSGNMIRINVQLIDSATDAHLWARTYDRELTAENVFRIQSEIAVAIAEALKAVLSPEEKQELDNLPTQNMDALEAYFQGQIWTGVDGVKKSIELFEEAISLDPNFADAYAALGRSIMNQSWALRYPVKDVAAQAKPIFEKALELDPRNALAYEGIARMKGQLGLRREAEQAYLKAIELSPSKSRSYAAYAQLLTRSMRRPDLALEVLEKGFAIAPKSGLLMGQYIESLSLVGRTDEAISLIESDTKNAFSERYASVYLEAGHFDQAIKILRAGIYEDPSRSGLTVNLAGIYERFGDREKYDFWRKRGHQLTAGRQVGLADKLMMLIENDQWAEAEILFAKESEILVTPGLVWTLRKWMKHDMETGQLQKPLMRYKSIMPEVFKADYLPNGEINPFVLFQAALSLEVAGEHDQANALFEKNIEDREPIQDKGLLVWLYSHTGKIENALEIVRENPMKWVYYYNDFDLGDLRGNPEFEALMKDPLQQVQVQLDRLDQWEANGELAPIPPLPMD